jgi:hypothetical protein
MILETLQAVSTSKYGFNDHIIMNGRTVAIRADYDKYKNTGLLNLRFSDSKVNSMPDYCVKGLSVKEAKRIIEIFIWGRRVLISHDHFGMEINQSDRWCSIDKRTPKRLRISYEMPNAGIMAGWWKYIQINDYAYLTN